MQVTLQNKAELRPNWDANGLLPIIVQDVLSGRVLMLGYLSHEALQKTLEINKVTFFSRSKDRLWTKGETSGHTLDLCSLWLDCDQDTFLALAVPKGPTCHNGTTSCFDESSKFPLPLSAVLPALEVTLNERMKSENDSGSYSQKLLAAPLDRVIRKWTEEAGEFVCALKNLEFSKSTSNRSEVVSETCDILFHALVLLQKSGVTLTSCYEELQNRWGQRRVQDGTVSKL
jgi:phosphoribosyl-AMP cyclohydrolase / phosphoribosyl-ATP pyrophosphohydrolase